MILPVIGMVRLIIATSSMEKPRDLKVISQPLKSIFNQTKNMRSKTTFKTCI